MRFDLVDVESLLGVPLEQASKDVSCVGREALKDLNVALRNLLHHLVPRLILLNGLLQWVDPADHFVEQHAQTPPIDPESVPVVQDDLGSQVLRRTAERVRQLVIRLFDLRQTEVGQLDVALGVEQHVFRLQIAIDDAL